MQPPPKKKGKLGLIIGIVVGAVVLCGVIGALGSHSSSSTTTTTPSDATSSSSAPAQQQQVPAKPQTWQMTHTFTGTGAKKTETFTVGNDWKITWTCQGTDGIDAPLYVIVYGSDGSIIDPNAVSTTCKAASPTTDSSEEHQGGAIYLDVNAGISWTLTISELK